MAEVRGWSRFFDELHRVISDSDRQIGVANEGYVQFITEKFETGLRSVNSIQETLSDAEQELKPPEREVASEELATCIQTMLSFCHLYQDRLDSVNTDETSYQIQVVANWSIYIPWALHRRRWQLC